MKLPHSVFVLVLLLGVVGCDLGRQKGYKISMPQPSSVGKPETQTSISNAVAKLLDAKGFQFRIGIKSGPWWYNEKHGTQVRLKCDDSQCLVVFSVFSAKRHVKRSHKDEVSIITDLRSIPGLQVEESTTTYDNISGIPN